ncbi:YqgE/AlgH family protein [Kangiella sp. HZ709]|uniref:YqgE/AlgH family protein n=1 Tax=Kangiella sp. HZ709 TaxID=2666328 RepID=UPI0012B02C5A|nr:YqgE/AlgH family protein [Kangiella sp. HZ709]MRX28114.1 YqgE/AlgH family protein [Kangiella sp. HZ709]
MQQINSLANHLLIAMPNLEDPFFSRSVTYICEHSSDGALGIVINTQLKADYQELFQHLNFATLDTKALKTKLLAGGPVSPERGFILHSPIGSWNSSLTVTDNIALSTSEDILTAIALNQGPEKVKIALGYAGWEKGQLEKELEENSWLFVEATESLLFDTPFDQIWDKATQLLGIDWTQLSTQKGHA